MGLIGLIATVVIMALGAGYYFFSVPGAPVIFTNEAPAPAPAAEGMALYESLKTQVNDIKETEEERVEKEIAEREAALDSEQPTISNQQSAPEEASGAKAANEAGIVDRLMTSGFSVPDKARTIDTIVLHSSYNPNGGDAYSVSALVKIYEGYGVSAHYLIDRSGTIYRLVEDKNIAYHAGVSKMPDGRKDVNDFSIGIEMMNKEDTTYTAAQYAAVNSLVSSLKKKYHIKNIVGHNNIAPDRKTDPWKFDWKKLK